MTVIIFTITELKEIIACDFHLRVVTKQTTAPTSKMTEAILWSFSLVGITDEQMESTSGEDI